MRAWIGKSIIFIGIVHSVFGTAVYSDEIAAIFSNGIFDTVDGHVERQIAFWFLFFGFTAIIAGLLADWCERHFRRLPGFFGVSLLLMASAFVVLMPVSGAWLLFVPAVATILRSIAADIKGKVDGLLKT